MLRSYYGTHEAIIKRQCPVLVSKFQKRYGQIKGRSQKQLHIGMSQRLGKMHNNNLIY